MVQQISPLICPAARVEVGGQKGKKNRRKRCKQGKRRGRTEEKIDSGTGTAGARGGGTSLTVQMETEGGDE